MRLFLHIGYHRTGTSYLQALLHSNSEFLKSQGYLYPTTGLVGHSHAAISLSISSKRNLLIRKMVPWHRRKSLLQNGWRSKTRQLFYDFSLELNASKKSSAIISSECFLELIDVNALKQQFSYIGLEPEIIVYIRRQDRWIESVYSQVIQDPMIAYSKSFQLLPQFRMLDFHSELDQWSNAFGASKIHAIPYQENDHGLGVAASFGQVIGLGERWGESTSVKLPDRHTNASLDECCVESLRIINGWKIEQRALAREILARTSKIFRSEGLFQTWRLSVDSARNLMAEHERRNESLFKTLGVSTGPNWGEVSSQLETPSRSRSIRIIKIERIVGELSDCLRAGQLKTLNKRLMRLA